MSALKILLASICFCFFLLPQQVYTQTAFGAEVGFAFSGKKNAFTANLFAGPSIGYNNYLIFNLGYERGEFNARPTDRILPYNAIRLGAALSFPLSFSESVYLGADFEYLQTTRIVDDSRISIIPKIGTRFLKYFYADVSGDNLNQPGDENGFFDINLSGIKLTLGFSYNFESIF